MELPNGFVLSRRNATIYILSTFDKLSQDPNLFRRQLIGVDCMPLFARAYLNWNNPMSKISYNNKNIEVSYLGVIFRFHEGSVEIISFATVCEISSG